MEPAYYRNFYSSSFAQPLPKEQRLEDMNSKLNVNELALYYTLALILTRTVVFAGKIKVDLEFSIVINMRARARAKCELAFSVCTSSARPMKTMTHSVPPQ